MRGGLCERVSSAMRDKLKNMLIISIPVLLALVGGIFLIYELDARQTPPLVSAQSEDILFADAVEIVPLPIAAQLPNELEEESPVAEPMPKQTPNGDNPLKPNTIYIRGKSYPLKSDIEEATLKKHIGWMNTSARPGEVGVCVVMGHRNQQLRCLKDVEHGDVITIVDGDGFMHPYTVESGQIVKDNNITFGATEHRVLVLITCYPFYYSGSAPYQYVVTAVA